jgi:isocitrate/isopropylmalate dehydrogenase
VPKNSLVEAIPAFECSVTAAARIMHAIEIVLAGDRDVLTPDLGGKGTTRGMGDAILASL